MSGRMAPEPVVRKRSLDGQRPQLRVVRAEDAPRPQQPDDAAFTREERILSVVAIALLVIAVIGAAVLRTVR